MSTAIALQLVQRSTRMATKVLQALGNADLAAHQEHRVVTTALSNLARSLHTVRGTLVLHEESREEQVTAVLFRTEVFVPDYNDYDRQPRDHAVIDQEIRGTKTLLLEVVRRAAYDWVLYRTSTRIVHKKLAEDAFTWLFEEAEGHPNWEERTKQGKPITAFLTICRELDLKVTTVRECVRKLTVKNVMSVGRPAEYRRRDPEPTRARALLGSGTEAVDFDDL